MIIKNYVQSFATVGTESVPFSTVSLPKADWPATAEASFISVGLNSFPLGVSGLDVADWVEAVKNAILALNPLPDNVVIEGVDFKYMQDPDEANNWLFYDFYIAFSNESAGFYNALPASVVLQIVGDSDTVNLISREIARTYEDVAVIPPPVNQYQQQARQNIGLPSLT